MAQCLTSRGEALESDFCLLSIIKRPLQRVETQKGHRRALGGVNLLARGTPGRRIEVQASVGATLRPTVLVDFRDLRSRSAYRVFSLTAVWSWPSVSYKQVRL